GIKAKVVEGIPLEPVAHRCREHDLVADALRRPIVARSRVDIPEREVRRGCTGVDWQPQRATGATVVDVVHRVLVVVVATPERSHLAGDIEATVVVAVLADVHFGTIPAR